MDGTERIIAKNQEIQFSQEKKGSKLCHDRRFQDTIVEKYCAHFYFAQIGRNLTAQLTGSRRGIGGRIQIPETQLEALLPFPAPLPEYPRELARRLSPRQTHKLHPIPR